MLGNIALVGFIYWLISLSGCYSYTQLVGCYSYCSFV